MSTTIAPTSTPRQELSPTRLNLMRGGYAFMAVGLALVKWPQLAEVATKPLYEGVTLAMLTAMSLLALLGLRHPAKLLPVLLFEVVWKLLWLTLVALPNAIGGDLTDAMAQTAFNCALGVVIIAVVPWRYAWTHYVRASGDKWR